MTKSHLSELGIALRLLRKQKFPMDDQRNFAFRIGVSRATYQRMESGDLSVSMQKYHDAAKLLGVSDRFVSLFSPPVCTDLFRELDGGTRQ